MDTRRWGIRPKLIALVLVPTIAALALAGLRMESALATSAAATRLETLARVLPQVDAVVTSLQAERDVTVGQLSAAAPTSVAGLSTRRARTDADVASLRDHAIGVDTSHDTSVQDKLRGALDGLSGLAELRRTATWAGVAPTSVATEYTKLIRGLIGLPGLLSAQSRNSEVTRWAAGLNSLEATKEAASQERLIMYSALRADGLRGTAFTDLIAANTAQRVDEADYLAVASIAGKALYRATVRGPAVDTVANAMTQVLGTGSTHGLGANATQWLAAASGMMSLIGRVQAGEVTSLTDRLDTLREAARRDALISVGVICALLGFALLGTLLVARSILRPLNVLRSAALDVAYRRLPETVRQLEETESPDAVLDIAPIGVDRKDEIGEVAHAVDAVHSEAARLAGQQAVTRDNVRKMFINLSRRSQVLVERQLRLIDQLEAGEQDADQLANLFQLDHLATRMRRNDESLLVLAGAEPGRQRSDPVPILDVLRAASAEVEQYARIRLDVQPGFELAAGVANDVGHLLAELIENATNFSQPDTPVWIRSRGLGAAGELMIEIEDHGSGMAPAELAAANDQLISPVSPDVAVAQGMGLFVVERLARRHGILVMLLASSSGGLAAYVRLPGALVAETVGGLVTGAPAPDPATSLQNAPIFDELQSTWVMPRPISGRLPSVDKGRRAAAATGMPALQSDARTPAGLPVRVPGRSLFPAKAPVEPAGGSATRTATHLNATESHAMSNPHGIHRARVATQGAIRHREQASGDTDEKGAQR